MILKQYTMDELLAMPVHERNKITKHNTKWIKIGSKIDVVLKIIALPITLLIRIYQWVYE